MFLRVWPSWYSRCVAGKLHAYAATAKHGRYKGRDLVDLLRAIRNIFEHWFDRLRDGEERERQRIVLQTLTSWDAQQLDLAQSGKMPRAKRASAVVQYFVHARFPTLLLIFE